MKFIDGVLLPGMLSGELVVDMKRVLFYQDGVAQGLVKASVGQLDYYSRIKKLDKLVAKRS